MKTPKNKTTSAQSEYGTLILLFHFFDKYLPIFPNSHFCIQIGANENTISSTLRRHLQYYSKAENYDFDFETESPQKAEVKQSEKRVDIGVNLFVKGITPNAIFCIEAKRLPIPNNNDRLVQEYIYGRTGKDEGGIERFKKSFHGKDWHGNLLPQNGMFGYVEEHDFQHWYSQINQWIEEKSTNSADWSKTEALKLICASKIAKLESTHPRIGRNAQVTLTHYWITIPTSPAQLSDNLS